MKKLFKKNLFTLILFIFSAVLVSSLINISKPNNVYAVTTTYTVTYNANGATSGTVPADAFYNLNEMVTVSGNTGILEKTGHTFYGWNTSSAGDGTTYLEDSQFTISGDITLFAMFEANTYTITLNVNGGDELTINTMEINYGHVISGLPTPTKMGNIFLGWFYGSTNITVGTSVYDYTQNITLTARWIEVYTISFNANGGESVESCTNTSGTWVTLPTTTKTGYTLDGWSDGTSTYSAEANFATPEYNIELIAVWSANTYTVVFDANEYAATGSMNNQNFTYGVEQNLTTNTYARADHYTFSGWNTDVAGGGTSYSDGASIINLTTVANDTVILYAVWTLNTHTVDYDFNGGDALFGIAQETYEYGATFNVVEISDLSKYGYSFGGWNDGTNTYAFNASYTMGDSNVVFTAVWNAITYKVAFNTNTTDTITGTMPDQNFTYNTSQNLITNTFARENYIFIGWNRNSSGTGTSYSDGASVNNLVGTNDATVTLYAVWALGYKISFDANGGEGAMTQQGFVLEAEQAISTNAFTKTCNTFSGWATLSDAKIADYDDEESISLTENTTLYALWRTTNTFNIYYWVNHPTLGWISYNSVTNITYGNTFSGLPIGMVTGYSSQWWTKIGDTDGDWGVQIINNSTIYKYISNLIVYEKRVARTYTVTLNKDFASATEGTTSITATYDLAMPEATAPTLSEANYQFNGFYTGQNGTGTKYYNADMTSATTWVEYSNTTLYAFWTPAEFTITYNLNEGTNNAGNPATYNIETENFTILNPAKTGYTFGGWYGDAELTTLADITIEIGSTGNLVFYAKWEVKEITIRFEVDGGTAEENIVGDYNSALTLPTSSRAGYIFIGWFLDEDLTIPALNLNSIPSENTTLYASWELATDNMILYYIMGGIVVLILGIWLIFFITKPKKFKEKTSTNQPSKIKK